MSAFFTTADDGKIVVRMRAEGGAMIGDMVVDVSPGHDFADVSYADMKKRGAGEISFDKDGNGSIVGE